MRLDRAAARNARHHFVHGLEDIEIVPRARFDQVIPPALGVAVAGGERHRSERIAARDVPALRRLASSAARFVGSVAQTRSDCGRSMKRTGIFVRSAN